MLLDSAEDVIHKDSAFKDIVPIFIKERRLESESIIQAIKVANYETIHSMGHKMQGAAEAFGFTTASKINPLLAFFI